MLAAAGLLLWLVACFIVLQAFGGWSTEIEGPGATEVDIPAAGVYRLWHRSRTVIDGQLHMVDDALPAGITVEVRGERGQRIPIEFQTTSMSVESDGSRRVAVGRISIPEAGIYTVSIQGLDAPRRFSLNEVRFLGYFMRALIFAIPGALLFMGALVGLLMISTRPKSQAT